MYRKVVVIRTNKEVHFNKTHLDPDGCVAISTSKSTVVSNNSGLRVASNTTGRTFSRSIIVTPNCTQLIRHFSVFEKKINYIHKNSKQASFNLLLAYH